MHTNSRWLLYAISLCVFHLSHSLFLYNFNFKFGNLLFCGKNMIMIFRNNIIFEDWGGIFWKNYNFTYITATVDNTVQ